jgi:hypothetical protein
VAGGITAGMLPLDTIVKECDEEASLPESLVRKHVRWVLDVHTIGRVISHATIKTEQQFSVSPEKAIS